MVENMRIALPYPERDFNSIDDGLDDLLRSLTLKHDNAKPIIRSVSFNGRDSEPVSKVQGFKKSTLNGSLSFNKTTHNVLEKSISNKLSRFAPSPKCYEIEPLDSPKHVAAVKLQKVYKSFRTRRQLADCAVLVEQRWWKLLDFAMLKQSSVSFFELKKTESVMSKWARAKSRAAKVGKGLSKDVKARKLALQHWLEAIDPRHRYGHNLHFYYDCWLRCDSRQPFFYWLDVGEGKEVSMDEKCSRSKLQHQCIKYLGPKERETYEVVVEDGKFMYKNSGVVLDTTNVESKDSKWIFVLSTSKVLYVGQKKKGTFQHSSFLAGGATSAAGRLEVENGVLKAIWPHSGHYRPTEENFQEFVTFLKSRNVDLTNVKKKSIEDEEEPYKLRPSRSELDLALMKPLEVAESNVNEIKSHKRSKSYDPSPDIEEMERLRTKKMMTYDSDESDEDESEEENKCRTSNGDEEAIDGSRTSDYKFRKPNLFEEQDEEERIVVPSELILRRMNFRKERLSLQLGRQLSCKWTTGAGPRIGCVSDFPSELRIQALEQVHLSPRSCEKGWPSPKNVPTPILRESTRV